MSGLQFFRVMFSTKLWSAFIVRRFAQEAPHSRSHVYHYTTSEGVKGIIESKSLWATGAYYLNDTSEIEYGCRLAAGHLEEKAGFAETEFARRVLSKAHNDLCDPVQQAIRIASYYVVCFCEDDNLLSQWRAYGRSGGFAVGFGREVEHLKAEGMTVSPLQKVLYEREEQVRRVDSLIEEMVGLFRDDQVCRGDLDDPSLEDIIDAASEVAQALLAAVVCFKAPDFAGEHEWRLVCQPIYSEDGARIEAIRNVVRFRSASRGLVPYLELKRMLADGGAGPLPIVSVRFGPTQTPDLTKSVTRMLLEANGLQDVKIDGSGIPVVLDR